MFLFQQGSKHVRATCECEQLYTRLAKVQGELFILIGPRSMIAKKEQRPRSVTAAIQNLPVPSCEIELAMQGGSKLLRFSPLSVLHFHLFLSFHGAEEEATKFSNHGRM
jgi:hypothetical protein